MPLSLFGGSSNFWAAQESLAILGVVSHVSRDGWERRLCPNKSLHPQLLCKAPLHSRTSEATRSLLQILVQRLGLFSPPWTPAPLLEFGACPQGPRGLSGLLAPQAARRQADRDYEGGLGTVRIVLKPDEVG